MTTGEQLTAYAQETLDRLERPIVIVETGCLRRPTETDHQNDGWSTLYLAKWTEAHPGTKFFSVDMDGTHIRIASEILHAHGVLPQFPMFTCGESVQFLAQFGGLIDFAYLDSSDGWEHGLAEFQQAEAKGATLIVMDDYIGKVVSAQKYAQANGWKVKQEGRFTAMRK